MTTAKVRVRGVFWRDSRSREHKKSAEHDEARMSRLKETFGGRPVGEISTQDVEHLRSLLGKKLSAASVNRHLALLKVTFNRAMRSEPPSLP